MTYKQKFIRFMCEAGVLTFGDFTAKSGRKTPYFVNTGNYRTGEHIAKLGEFYAECIHETGVADKCDIFYGPAYKGIPLCVTTAVAYYNKYGKSFKYCFNRKEAKDHGEGGIFIGQKPQDGDRVVIIEDVITAGTAMRETVPILKSEANVDISAVIISVDRMEKGTQDISAVQQVRADFGISVFPIVTVLDIIECISQGIVDGKEYLDKMYEYREKYGVL